MKVAFLHPDLGIGGAERLVVDAARALQRRGHGVAIFTARHDPARSFASTRDGSLDVRVRARRFPAEIAGRLRLPCAIARMSLLARAAAREHFDAVFCDLVPQVIPLARRLTAAPVIYYCHFPDLLLAHREAAWLRLYRLPLDRWEGRATGRADRILVNSAFTETALRRAFPDLDARVIVLRPGVEPPSADTLRPPSASHTIASIGRLSPEKNHTLALDAFALLRDRLPADVFAPLRLVIAGGYDERFVECRETAATLERGAREYGLAEQIEILRSPDDARRKELLSRCRCVVHCAPEEHFGYVPIEAMAAARPVLAANRGGPTETVVDGETGFLRSPEPAAYADAVARLLSEPATADRLGSAGRRRVEQSFSLEEFGAKLERIVLEVADRF
jgi:alpha-1,3/alpha-1,6-mannosyltransferase